MVANVYKPSRRLTIKSLRLILMRRVLKRVESIATKLRDEVHELMDSENLEVVKLPSGSVTRYISDIQVIAPRELYNLIGDDAFDFMRVNVGDAKREIGEVGLRNVMFHDRTHRKLLTKGNPTKKKVTINA
jgi:hypothetical protein